MRPIVLSAIVLAAFALCSYEPQICQAVSYVFKDLGTLDGTRTSRGYALNERGEVVGRSGGNVDIGLSSSKVGNAHATLYRGSYTDLGDLTSLVALAYYGPPIISEVTFRLDEAFDVNNGGQVVGTAYYEYRPSDFVMRGFLFDGSTMRSLGSLRENSSSVARGINDNGQVVGWSFTDIRDGSRLAIHAFRYDDGTMHDLGTLGGFNSHGYGINGSGYTTGDAQIADDLATHAFLHDGAMMHDLGTLGGTNSYGRDINVHGYVAGYSYVSVGSNDNHAFLYDGATMRDLGTLGGGHSIGYGINSHGQVVGESWDDRFRLRAFLYTEELGMVDLNSMTDLPPGWELRSAWDINDAGQITGYGWNDGGFDRGFLLTPVPEPGILVLAALALMCGLIGARFRRSAIV
jgi:probable HAF family extracellular repeat protein